MRAGQTTNQLRLSPSVARPENNNYILQLILNKYTRGLGKGNDFIVSPANSKRFSAMLRERTVALPRGLSPTRFSD
jgi:hypothetical protein